MKAMHIAERHFFALTAVIAVISLLLTILVLSPPSLETFEQEAERQPTMLTVRDNTALVFRQQTSTSEVIGKIARGDSYPVIEQSSYWTKIAYNGASGWIASDAGQVFETPSQAH